MLAYFSGMTDPRIDRTKLHSLHNIIVMALCGAIGGADGWDDLEEFSEERQEWFETFLEMPNGTPSADTFRRVFSALDPTEFEGRFRAWLTAFAGSLEGKVVAIDGKTLRGALERATQATALHLLHVWAAEQQVLLAHCAVEGAPGEIEAIPSLLKLVNVKGAIVTTDANGCTADVTKAVREAEADYLLALKGNRSTLHDHVRRLFVEAEERSYRGVATARSADQGHGREEQRVVRAMPLGELPENNHAEWIDLRTIVQIERTRTVAGETTCEREFFITSLPPLPKRIAKAIREHWSVENQLHWCLDVGFDEDRRRIRDQNAAQNFATIVRCALAMIKRTPLMLRGKVRSRGVAAKRKNAGWSTAYLLSVLTTGIAQD